ncbi:ankyrin repeat-containing domain protein [Biscogniauxia mediterranea]|nr:ankyrin repeat-containing domain protein [Biscogniauxia mediterranea]
MEHATDSSEDNRVFPILDMGNSIASVKMPPITRLPDEVILVLGGFLEIPDLKAMVRTCRQMHQTMTLALYENDVRSGYNHALVEGCIRGNLAIVSQAVRSGAPVNPNSHRDWYKMLPRFGNRLPLTLSVAPDRINILRFLLENGAAPNHAHYQHPLTMALELYRHHPLSQHGKIKDIITCLLQYGADPLASDSFKKIPLLNALKEHVPLDAFRLLLDEAPGVKYIRFNGRYLWEYHILGRLWHDKDLSMEKFFLAYCASTCTTCFSSICLPTMREIVPYGSNNTRHVLERLLHEWADPNVRVSTLPGSALWSVCQALHDLSSREMPEQNRRKRRNASITSKVYERMAQALLRAGANPDNTEEEYKAGLHSPLLLLCSGQLFYPETITYLLEHFNPDVNHTNEDKYTALHWVLGRRDPYPLIVKQLLDHGADVNAAAIDGWTPLHQAVFNCERPDDRLEIVQMLVEAGADVSLKNKWGHSALYYVGEGGEHVYRYLDEKSAESLEKKIKDLQKEFEEVNEIYKALNKEPSLQDPSYD